MVQYTYNNRIIMIRTFTHRIIPAAVLRGAIPPIQTNVPRIQHAAGRAFAFHTEHTHEQNWRMPPLRPLPFTNDDDDDESNNQNMHAPSAMEVPDDNLTNTQSPPSMRRSDSKFWSRIASTSLGPKNLLPEWKTPKLGWKPTEHPDLVTQPPMRYPESPRQHQWLNPRGPSTMEVIEDDVVQTPTNCREPGPLQPRGIERVGAAPQQPQSPSLRDVLPQATPAPQASPQALMSTAPVVSPKNPSSKYKTYSSKISWGGYSYTVRESLPDSTTAAEWDTIVESYKAILETRTQYAGVSRLNLKLDQTSKQMEIDIPEKSIKITVKDSEDYAVNGLLHFRIDGKLEEFKATLTLRNSSPRSIQDEANAASITPRNLERVPASIDVHTIIRGIPNQGNTCFIASICQSWLIYQTDALKRKLEKTNDENKKADIRVLLDWIESYKTCEQVSVEPILSLLKTNKPSWFSHTSNQMSLTQQDAHDFMSWLNEFMIHEGVKTYLDPDSSKIKLAKGETFVDVDSQHNDASSDIQLTLSTSDKSFLSMIREAFRPNDLLTCAIIQMPNDVLNEREVPAKKLFNNAPQELNFHIQRTTQAEVSGINEILEFGENVAGGQSKRYKLESFVVHSGPSMDRGHYVAYVRKIDPKTGKDHFFLTNDGAITPITLDGFLKAAKKAYLIRYKRIEI